MHTAHSEYAPQVVFFTSVQNTASYLFTVSSVRCKQINHQTVCRAGVEMLQGKAHVSGWKEEHTYFETL